VTLRYARTRITGLAVNQTGFTGARGASFTVTPVRSGHMFIRADACLGADHIPVLPAENLCGSVVRPADGSPAEESRRLRLPGASGAARPWRGPPARMAC
jgi:hypothetical protein